jgi:serine/threonine-protein kinase
MGVVWAATNTATGRRVAIKMLRDEGDDPHVRRRFLREGRAASAVQHPNVVEILDVLELEDRTPVMVMELLEGESLGTRLRARGTLSVEDMCSLLVPAVAAVGAAHALGVVHRDLKPDNIFLGHDADGNTVVKVLDFGIAKMTTENDQGSSNALTGTGAMLGTPYYMAPEQLFSDETLDYRCDIWAFGIIFYECLAGKRPTRGDNFADIVKVIATHSILKLETVAPTVPPEICALVGRMLSFNKKDRPQSLHEVLNVLKHYTDTMARSFGDPLLKQIKQTRDDPSSSSSGLRRADLALLGEASPQSTNDAVTIDAPASRRKAEVVEESGAPTVDLSSATRRVSMADTASELPASTPPRRPVKLYAIVGIAIAAVALVGVRIATKTAPAAPLPEPPTASVVVTPPDAGAPVVVAAVEPMPTVSATPSARPSATAMRPRPPPTPAPQPRPAPDVAPKPTNTASPGGLVEKPPF